MCPLHYGVDEERLCMPIILGGRGGRIVYVSITLGGRGGRIVYIHYIRG